VGCLEPPCPPTPNGYTVSMLQPPHEAFRVYARDGSRILADVGPEPSARAVALAWQNIGLTGTNPLRPATGRYNCHGLVFASRRANIPPVGADIDIHELLGRDGYENLGEEPPHVGDIVAYRLDGEIEHTGFVSRVEKVGAVPVVYVWSAWGGLGEFEHKVKDCPYTGKPEYWRHK